MIVLHIAATFLYFWLSSFWTLFLSGSVLSVGESRILQERARLSTLAPYFVTGHYGVDCALVLCGFRVGLHLWGGVFSQQSRQQRGVGSMGGVVSANMALMQQASLSSLLAVMWGLSREVFFPYIIGLFLCHQWAVSWTACQPSFSTGLAWVGGQGVGVRPAWCGAWSDSSDATPASAPLHGLKPPKGVSLFAHASFSALDSPFQVQSSGVWTWPLALLLRSLLELAPFFLLITHWKALVWVLGKCPLFSRLLRPLNDPQLRHEEGGGDKHGGRSTDPRPGKKVDCTKILQLLVRALCCSCAVGGRVNDSGVTFSEDSGTRRGDSNSGRGWADAILVGFSCIWALGGVFQRFAYLSNNPRTSNYIAPLLSPRLVATPFFDLFFTAPFLHAAAFPVGLLGARLALGRRISLIKACLPLSPHQDVSGIRLRTTSGFRFAGVVAGLMVGCTFLGGMGVAIPSGGTATSSQLQGVSMGPLGVLGNGNLFFALHGPLLSLSFSVLLSAFLFSPTANTLLSLLGAPLHTIASHALLSSVLQPPLVAFLWWIVRETESTNSLGAVVYEKGSNQEQGNRIPSIPSLLFLAFFSATIALGLSCFLRWCTGIFFGYFSRAQVSAVETPFSSRERPLPHSFHERPPPHSFHERPPPHSFHWGNLGVGKRRAGAATFPSTIGESAVLNSLTSAFFAPGVSKGFSLLLPRLPYFLLSPNNPVAEKESEEEEDVEEEEEEEGEGGGPDADLTDHPLKTNEFSMVHAAAFAAISQLTHETQSAAISLGASSKSSASVNPSGISRKSRLPLFLLLPSLPPTGLESLLPAPIPALSELPFRRKGQQLSAFETLVTDSNVLTAIGDALINKLLRWAELTGASDVSLATAVNIASEAVSDAHELLMGEEEGVEGGEEEVGDSSNRNSKKKNPQQSSRFFQGLAPRIFEGNEGVEMPPSLFNWRTLLRLPSQAESPVFTVNAHALYTLLNVASSVLEEELSDEEEGMETPQAV